MDPCCPQVPVIRDGEEGEGEEEEEEIPETRIEVEIPKINSNLGRHLHFVKLPNFLSVETRYELLMLYTSNKIFIHVH